MKASELIENLKRLILDHGDLDVVDDCDEPVFIYFNETNSEGDYEPVFVVE